MKYLKTKKLFLFDMISEYIELLDEIDEVYNHTAVIKKINEFFLNISDSFIEIIFKIVFQHTNKLKLYIFSGSKTMGVSHIKNIYKEIVSDSNVKRILEGINYSIKKIDSLDSKFDIKKYGQLISLIEELDFVCMFEMYSYLLNEDSEGVFSFILDELIKKILKDYDYDEEILFEVFLSQVEDKINLFKKLYNDEEICLVSKNKDHIIYKINGVLKIVYI